MDLGQKIKEARLEAGLSQRQLCGEVCTRNMLSLIESGKAKPSMETLRHFARQLGRPLSWFLEEEAAMVSPNQAAVEKAETAWKAGDFSGGLEALGQYRGPDPVFDGLRYLLEVQCLLALARGAVDQGKLPYARMLLDRASQAGAHTPYPWDRQQWILLRAETGEDVRQLASRLTGIAEALMLLAEAALAGGEPERAVRYLAAVDVRAERWHLLYGRAMLEKKEYAPAAEALSVAEHRYPGECLPALEVCWRELGNFELAYKYACKIREM